eukprot:CAMPEP_0176348130 /NCGR_PEP_ID=MMETSP0126-20121128/7624_1 /TAXON_ID=141414 ORGANISM="Strombidinopsis acuminatum, Strain SPMC142" /NCGR_SAMPLE_ID=MMETSP0126 /ASSEMBLY_ACC=CAM_ASM_000229 /LENGTH=88 /DNA_ID=CAMNT_0017696747 /DNA_START=1776 /DNA_END=2042 /DNA_ORIENTATION=-
MTSAHRDVTYSQLRFVTSSKFKGVFVFIRHNYMNHAGGVFLKGQGFKPQEIPVFWNINIYKSVFDAVGLEHIRIRLLANLTLKLLPSV